MQVLGAKPYPERSDLPRLPELDLFMKEVLRIHVVSLGVARR